MKTFKFEFSYVKNEERVFETILFKTHYYSLTEGECLNHKLGEYYTTIWANRIFQQNWFMEIFGVKTWEECLQLMTLPGARFAITEARIITII